jgi:hypothetical protein
MIESRIKRGRATLILLLISKLNKKLSGVRIWAVVQT